MARPNLMPQEEAAELRRKFVRAVEHLSPRSAAEADNLVQEPFGRLLEEEEAELRRKLVRAVKRTSPRWLAAEADDLVQEALVRVLELARRREGDVEFSAFYLRRAAYSVVVDEIRRRRRRRELPLDLEIQEEEEEEETSLLSKEPDPEEFSRSRELGRAILSCLGRMVRPRRLAVELHLQGHRIRDVAALMGWKDKKAENLIFRGLKDLRCCLEEYESISSSDTAESRMHSITPESRHAKEGHQGWNQILGPFYTEVQVIKLLGLTSMGTLASLRRHYKILALKTADGAFVYPAIQFDDQDHVLEDLPEVLKILADSGVDDWSLAGWFVSSMPSLGDTSPIEWLREGGDRQPLFALAHDAAERFSR